MGLLAFIDSARGDAGAALGKCPGDGVASVAE